jgi:hypothetical protein
VIYKGFCSKFRLRDNIVSDFNLSDRLVIPFKFRNIFPKVPWLGPKILANRFEPNQPVSLNGSFDQLTII